MVLGLGLAAWLDAWGVVPWVVPTPGLAAWLGAWGVVTLVAPPLRLAAWLGIWGAWTLSSSMVPEAGKAAWLGGWRWFNTCFLLHQGMPGVLKHVTFLFCFVFLLGLVP